MTELMSMTDRQYCTLQAQQYKLARVTYEPQMREIADTLLPYRLRMGTSDSNRGDRMNTRMLDGTASYAVDTLENGFMNAASDPSSVWVRFTVKDADRAEYGPHKEWLDELTQVTLGILDESDAYVSLPTLYGNGAGFGTAAMSVTESFKGATIKTDVYPNGGFWISQDDEANVVGFYEEIRMSVRQLYEMFGRKGSFSGHVQKLIDDGKWEQWVDVAHLIEPNAYETPGVAFSQSKPYASWWFETGASSQSGIYGYADGLVAQNKFLRRSGFDSFPIMVFRWELTKGDTYAVDCPGMKALGDIKSLQNYEKRAAQGIDKIVNPHWIAPESLMGQADHGFIPGGTTYVTATQEGAVRPAHMIPPGFLDPVTQKEAEIRKRIGTAFFTDLFQLFDTLPDKERTATEIMQRKSEKLTKLSKPYANLQKGVFRPMLNRVYQIAMRRGMIRPAPPDLQGHELAYEYNGILAQAQKMVKVQPVERLLQTVTQVAGARPEDPSVWDAVNLDKAFYEIADGLNIPAAMMNSAEVVAQIRQARAEQQAQAQKMAMAEQASRAAKNLGGANMGPDTALGALAGRTNAA